MFNIEFDDDTFEPLKHAGKEVIHKKIEKEESVEFEDDIKSLILLKHQDEEKFNKKIEEYSNKMKKQHDKIKKKKLQKIKNRNLEKLKKLLKEKNATNNFTYFKKMKIKEQQNILKSLLK